jgi:hypothetical protein
MSACVPIPSVSLPELPTGISIAPALPAHTFDTELCCKLLPWADNLPAAQLPPGIINPAVMVAINTIIQQVQSYIDRIPLRCPRE